MNLKNQKWDSIEFETYRDFLEWTILFQKMVVKILLPSSSVWLTFYSAITML